MGSQATASGPDLEQGIADSELHEGQPLVGQVRGEAVVLVRDAGRIHALGATCTHYGGPLGEGIVDGGAIHCPWHHACFDLETGRAGGPALAAVPCFDVVLEGGKIRVGAKRDVKVPEVAAPGAVVIVGGGAAGTACAEALRAEGHRGAITIVAGEGSDPVDRPNLSKDYLAGNAPEEWVYLRTTDALAAQQVTLVADSAAAIDTKARTVRTAGGRTLSYDALLVATGAEPVRLALPGADLPHVHTLRTLADSRAIAAAQSPVVIIGASFIGLEVAASLRARNIKAGPEPGRLFVDVTVVGPEAVPLARVLGDEVGAFVRRVHEGKGVKFQLGKKPVSITDKAVTLDDGTVLPAATVVMGVGVKPRLQLAEAAGLEVDRGIVVDAQLRAAPGVWAAGDVARYPWDGAAVRIEHWQVAVRHGQAVARDMLGKPPRRDVPFFWSQHHDVTLGYVGHAEKFDRVEIHGDLEARDAHIAYREGGRVTALVTIGRDKLSLEVEAAMQRGDHAAVDKLVTR